MVSSIGSANIASAILGQIASNSGGVDFTSLFAAQSGQGGGQVYSAASATVALKNAAANEDKQLAQTAKQPDVQRDLARYAKVVQNAKTIDDVLNDPIARKVLLTANGLSSAVDQVGLAKRALASDPADTGSVANQLKSVNSAWVAMVNKYDFAHNGLDHLRANTSGFTGDWDVTVTRDGKPLDAEIVIKNTPKNGWVVTVSGNPAAVSVTGDTVTVSYLWEDSAEKLHTTKLTGKLGKDGTLSGTQTDDSKAVGAWSAKGYYASAVKDVSDNYIAEKRLDMLDAQLPGLGSAVLFTKMADTLDTPIKILGSALGREIVTTALNLPKQMALQSLEAQTKAITQRLDPAKLKNPGFASQLATRYLIVLNGGTGGITA